ncbi:peptide MFS transporter [Sciscionella sediminilitoris]|uniref:peptide MFS transporter n=1 Tax=Sciscionella sediminilitoris TaxID=1445613 RepID=UPI0004DF65A3|nr:peptide MFS transporter [Sciscionella sp. SE31]
MTTTAPTEEEKPQQYGFFGHPFALSTLFATEFWERFSYYGMKALLIYYMYYQVTEGGLGIDQGLATALMSVYGALVYMAGIPGGWIADRLLGAQRSVALGAVLIMCGHIVLSLPGGGLGGLYGSMVLIVLGTGLLKTNTSKIVGDLYDEKDIRRDAGFSIFYMSVNAGGFIAPLVLGPLRDLGGFHLGFLAAAIGMAIGLVWYVSTRKVLKSAGQQPPNPIGAAERKRAFSILGLVILVVAVYLLVLAVTGALTADVVIYSISGLAFIAPISYFTIMLRSKKSTPVEKSRLVAFIPLFIVSMFFWMIQEQGANIGAVFADKRTDLHIFGWSINPEFFQSINPLAIVILAPVFAYVWTRLGTRQISTPVKFGIGGIIGGISFLILVFPGWISGTDAKVSPWWLFSSFVVVVLGELLISPVGLSATTKLAPAAFTSQMMGLWFLNNAAGQGINALITPLYSADTETGYFLIVGAVPIVASIVLLTMAPWIKKKMMGVP